MSNLVIGWSEVASLFGLLAFRVSIGVALMPVSFVGITVMLNLSAAFGIVSAMPFNLIGDWSLTAIPMFLFMWFLAANTGLTAGAFDLLRLMLVRVPGGLASATSGPAVSSQPPPGLASPPRQPCRGSRCPKCFVQDTTRPPHPASSRLRERWVP